VRRVDDFPTLDLHGIRHENAEILIEDFILKSIDDLPIAIVTGHSDHYREVLKQLVEKWELKMHPQWWWNQGCWIIEE